MNIREIQTVVTGRPTLDGAGVHIRRTLGRHRHDLDPFLMIDEIRSDDEADFGAGFPPHPHRGIETLTLMFKGGFEHRDHLGNRAELRDGGAQWMSAGRGVIHSEMPLRSGEGLHGFQIWINLPARDKLKSPEYAQADAAELPWHELANGVRVRAFAGSWTLQGHDIRSPLQSLSAAARVLELVLPAHQACRLPAAAAEAVLVPVIDGALLEGVEAGHTAIFGQGDGLVLRAGEQGAHALVLCGTPLGEPIAQHGPFVMNTDAEIHEAIEAYRNGTLTGESNREYAFGGVS